MGGDGSGALSARSARSVDSGDSNVPYTLRRGSPGDRQGWSSVAASQLQGWGAGGGGQPLGSNVKRLDEHAREPGEWGGGAGLKQTVSGLLEGGGQQEVWGGQGDVSNGPSRRRVRANVRYASGGCQTDLGAGELAELQEAVGKLLAAKKEAQVCVWGDVGCGRLCSKGEGRGPCCTDWYGVMGQSQERSVLR